MKFVVVKLFSNYVSAHIVLGRLQEEGINCWLKDEISGTLAPPFFPYREGIKLMVAEVQVERALQILNDPI
jgi:hypothetical protein